MWFSIKDERVTLRIFAKPNAKKHALVAQSEQGLHVSLHAKPQDGEANKALIAFLATVLKLPKSHIQLLRGEQSRHKCVSVPLTARVRALLDDPQTFIAQL